MEQPSETILRAIAFDQELTIAVKLIKCGLALLQSNKLYKQKHFVFLMLLSSGIERLAKLALYLYVYELEKRHLSREELRTWNHDVELLIDEVLSRCFTTPYTLRAFASDDLQFLKQDQNLRRMLKLLSAFAKRDRYIYMDGISDPSSLGESPEMLWEEFQRNTLPKAHWLKLVAEDKIEEFVEEMNRSAVVHCEKLVRALARLFIFGVLGNQGKQFSSYLREFSSLEDVTLGSMEYQY